MYKLCFEDLHLITSIILTKNCNIVCNFKNNVFQIDEIHWVRSGEFK